MKTQIIQNEPEPELAAATELAASVADERETPPGSIGIALFGVGRRLARAQARPGTST